MIGLKPDMTLDGDDLSGVLHGSEVPKGEAISAYLARKEQHPSVSIRTPDYRLTRYGDGSMELFDHGTDPFEHTNLLAPGSINENILAIARDLDRRLPPSPAPGLSKGQGRSRRARKRRSKRMMRKSEARRSKRMTRRYRGSGKRPAAREGGTDETGQARAERD